MARGLRFLSTIIATVSATTFACQEQPAAAVQDTGSGLVAEPVAHETNPETKLTFAGTTPPAGATGPAWSVTTMAKSPWLSGTALQWGTTIPVRKGDRLQLSFWYRSRHTTAADANVSVSLASTKTAGERILVGRIYNPTTEWRKIEMACKSFDDFAPGNLRFELWLGAQPQDLEIAGISLENHGEAYAEYNLRNSVRYGGSSPDAPWRRAAEERIRKFRMKDVVVHVEDSRGRAVPGANVRLRMNSNEFKFGTAVQAWAVGSSLHPGDPYQEHLLQSFNSAVFENDTKWIQPSHGWLEWDGTNNPNLIPAARFLKEQGFYLRGHCLVWPRFGFINNAFYYLPRDLSAKVDGKALSDRITKHFYDVLKNRNLNGLFGEWDVVNEAFTNRDLQGTIPNADGKQADGVLGNQALIEWYRLFDRLAPKTKAYYNDYGTIEGNPDKAMKYDMTLIDFIRKGGGRIDGVGLQSHFSAGSGADMESLYQRLQAWSALGLELKITEYDMDANGPGVGQFLADYLTLCYSMPSVKGFFMWGFHAGHMYQARSALYDANWNATASGEAWNELVRKRWRSDLELTSDAKGLCAARVYKGSYSIAASSSIGSGKAVVEIVGDDAPASVTIRLSR